MPLSYPAPPTADQVDDFHGTPVADPYRPLEDAGDPAVRDWIAAQNALSGGILASIPSRDAIAGRLAALWNVPRAGAPWRKGGRWFQLRNTGLQNQDVLWTADGPDEPGRVLLDPNGLNAQGTTTLNAIAVSESGRFLAVATADAGSDWQTWRVRRTDTGEDLPDRIPWSKFSDAAWTHDDAGFVYGRYPTPPADAAYDAPNRDMELRYHRLGTDPADDPLVFATPDEPEWGFNPEISADGSLLVITVWRGTDPENRVYVADIRDGIEGAVVRPLLERADAHYEPVGAIGRIIYLLTDLDAPRRRLVAVDAGAALEDAGTADPAERREPALREVIPQGPDTLEGVDLVGNRLAAITLHHAYNRLSLFELDGTPVGDVELPGIGTIAASAGEREDPDLYLVLDRFTAPKALVAVRMADGVARVVGGSALPWNPDDFETEQVFVESGGVRVPLFLTRRRDLRPTGDVPTLLYAYGGFQVPIGPMFKPEWLAWMERGGLLAVASLRGGGEYGTPWHDDGRLANKQHVFDDFAACLRWLAASGWTRPARIGVTGRSNGGLLIGAALTQYPELFGAAVPEVGVMDMLRFHRFTIGWGWTSDYGSPDDPEQFPWVHAYSPLHNIRPGTAYPPTLVTTGDHDDRVVPGHSFKFAAALQAAQAGDAPVLIRIDTDAGHGAGKPVAKLIEERADVLAFLELALGVVGPAG
ncbi:MAG TPA: prolyl oligopeptidase family serine peptidase [Candidatus Limnocylindrales bacterium]|nr:prolyl oligopeptidase family serine peptidase [Candidatus Limnocylindrales bacterium]